MNAYTGVLLNADVALDVQISTQWVQELYSNHSAEWSLCTILKSHTCSYERPWVNQVPSRDLDLLLTCPQGYISGCSKVFTPLLSIGGVHIQVAKY